MKKSIKIELTKEEVGELFVEYFKLEDANDIDIDFQIEEIYGNNDSLLGSGPIGEFDLEKVVITYKQ